LRGIDVASGAPEGSNGTVIRAAHHPLMDQLGDFLRDLIAPIYPLRVPIAIATLGAAVLLAIVARRRGWFAVARRHPARATVLAVVVLAVALPLGWWLGSPLFTSTAINEPAPTTSSAPDVTMDPAAPTSLPTAGPPVAGAGPTGEFVGADDFHFGRGTASLVEVSPGTWTLRFEDFAVRNGPDLYIYLSPDPSGYVDGAIELTTLRANEGSFNTEIPSGLDVSDIRSVVIWCKAFSVEFAVAELR
jgi:hypothetical protein